MYGTWKVAEFARLLVPQEFFLYRSDLTEAQLRECARFLPALEPLIPGLLAEIPSSASPMSLLIS